MARILFVVQEDTDRVFALPTRPDGVKWEKLREGLDELRETEGEVVLDPSARKWYEEWYAVHKRKDIEDEKFAGYHERKPDHLLRIGMILRVARAGALTLMPEDFQHSLAILDWLEAKFPIVFKTVAETNVGSLQQRLLKQIESAGGKVPHSTLLRHNQHVMNARTFRECIETLKESECIEEVRTQLEHFYRRLK